MKPVVTPREMRRIEEKVIDSGTPVLDLMERAGQEVALFAAKMIEENSLPREVLLLVGKGNNGGDALVCGRYLLEHGYTVSACLVDETLSSLPTLQHKAFLEAGGTSIELSNLPGYISSFGLIIDGLFGTGFRGAAEIQYAQAIHLANNSFVPTLSIDIPSGVCGTTGEVGNVAILAVATCTIEYPKTGLFLGEGWNHAGTVFSLEIGLATEEAHASFSLLELSDLPPYLPSIQRNRHKYKRGHAMLFAGSCGMTGSAFLAALGAFRGGCGLVHLMIEQGTESAYNHLPELITFYETTYTKEALVEWIDSASAALFGPGFGRAQERQALLEELITSVSVPTVLDADALYLLANTSLDLPPQTLLTPHLGEMRRLLGLQQTPSLDLDVIEKVQAYATEMQVSILLKGAPSFYVCKEGTPPIVLPFGDPGMATAGSGDLLSGILTALLAQGVPLKETACLGASLHGLAGELAALEVTSYCMKAQDIAEALPKAFQKILTNCY